MQIYVRDDVLEYVIVLSKKRQQQQKQKAPNSKKRTEKKNISCLNTTLNSVVDFVIARFMICIVYKLCVYLRTHCSNTPRSRIEPKVLGKILVPPELSDQRNTVNIKINLAVRV